MFKPAWWISGANQQTLWPNLLPPLSTIQYRRERLETPDGDFLDLDWRDLFPEHPLIVILHGLTGSSSSTYVTRLVSALKDIPYGAVIINFRGCSGEPNRLLRSYHSGETDDLAYVLENLTKRFPGRPIGLVGYSLGGNVLLKYLGESRNNKILPTAACAVSVPFDLSITAQTLDNQSRFYQWRLLKECKQHLMRKAKTHPIDVEKLNNTSSFLTFDHEFTAPIHGFASGDDYYHQSSAKSYLKGITTPTLIIHAKDDPFMKPEIIPRPRDVSASTTLEISEKGGHVGFIEGTIPGRGRYWLQQRIPCFLQSHLQHALYQ